MPCKIWRKTGVDSFNIKNRPSLLKLSYNSKCNCGFPTSSIPAQSNASITVIVY